MKKFLFNIAILLCCLVGIGAAMGVVLIIAPGVDFYDVEFVNSNSSVIDEKESFLNASTNVEEIVINADSAPIIISAEQTKTLTVEFSQNFMGFSRQTKSPSFDAKLFNKVVTVNVINYKTFLFGQNDDDYGIHISLPLYYKGRLTINANSSNVIYKNFNMSIDCLNITTTGKIDLKNELTINDINLYVKNKDVILSDTVKINSSVKFISDGADLKVVNNVPGDIDFTSQSGDLIYQECQNLKFKGKSSNIYGAKEVAPTVNGSADIETLGDVSLTNIIKDAKIKTKYGDVFIGKINNIYEGELVVETQSGDITLYGEYRSNSINLATASGNIRVNVFNQLSVANSKGKTVVQEVNNFIYNGGVGKLNVKAINSFSKIITQNGDISIGNEVGGQCANVEIESKDGSILIGNAIGNKYLIKTKRGNVDFKLNKNLNIEPDIEIESSTGMVNIENIKGKTKIKTNNDVTATIQSVVDKIEIDSGNGDVNLLVYDKCFYSLTSTKKNIENAPSLGASTKTYSTEPNPSNESKTVYVKTKWGKISVQEY